MAKCPICLGKGYATDEDIKEYPHRCPNCNGQGFYSVDWQKVRCEVCNGSGKKPMTNEEWFDTLTTEEKAEFFHGIVIRVMHATWDGKKPDYPAYLSDWKKWLKEKHE